MLKINRLAEPASKSLDLIIFLYNIVLKNDANGSFCP
jgi:hypothetical protein